MIEEYEESSTQSYSDEASSSTPRNASSTTKYATLQVNRNALKLPNSAISEATKKKEPSSAGKRKQPRGVKFKKEVETMIKDASEASESRLGRRASVNSVHREEGEEPPTTDSNR